MRTCIFPTWKLLKSLMQSKCICQCLFSSTGQRGKIFSPSIPRRRFSVLGTCQNFQKIFSPSIPRWKNHCFQILWFHIATFVMLDTIGYHLRSSRLMSYLFEFCSFYVILEDFKWYPMVPRWYPMVPNITKVGILVWNHKIWKWYKNQFYHCCKVCYELSIMLGFKVKTLIFEKLKIWSQISWKCKKFTKSRTNTAESAFESLDIILLHHPILGTIGVPCRSIHLIKVTPWKA